MKGPSEMERLLNLYVASLWDSFSAALLFVLFFFSEAIKDQAGAFKLESCVDS